MKTQKYKVITVDENLDIKRIYEIIKYTREVQRKLEQSLRISKLN